MSDSRTEATSPPSTSSAAGSHARTSPRRAKAPALRARGRASGSNSTALQKSSRRHSSSSRTSTAVPGVGCPMCGETCTCWATERVHLDFLPSTAERPTDANACSFLLPTPSASSYGTNKGGAAGRKGKVRPSLQTMARKGLLPTPTVKGNYNRKGLSPASGDGLATAINQLLPTPTARDWKSGASNLHEKNARPLNEVIHRETPGPLSPRFVEWLMGFPDGWTDCANSETQSLPSNPQQSAA